MAAAGLGGSRPGGKGQARQSINQKATFRVDDAAGSKRPVQGSVVMGNVRVRLAQGVAFRAMLLVAACGGGGVNSTPAPPHPTPSPSPSPTPVPSPTPTPTPPPTNYDTAEYRGTVGAVSMNA